MSGLGGDRDGWLGQAGSLLRDISDGVTVQNAEGRLVYANDMAARLCGLSDAEAMLAMPRDELLARFEMIDETGAPVTPAMLPGRRALSGEKPEPLLVGALDRSTGVTTWTVVRADAIQNASGAPELVINVIHDVTASHRQKQAAHLLEKATDELSSSLDYETSLRSVADALVPAFADWSVVELLARGELRTLAVAHADPAVRNRARQGLGSRRRRDEHSPVARVIASGEPLLLQEVTDEDLVACARDDAHLEYLRTLQIRSILCAPILVAGGGVEGAIVLMSAESRRTFDDRDIGLARELGRRAGTAIGHARAYRAAREAVQARDDFLSVAAHELRTPLATVVLQLESLKRALAAAALSPKSAADRVQKTLEQTNRLNRLLDALLDVTRVTAGRLVLEPEPMDLSELVCDVGERFADEAARANVSMTVTTETQCKGVWDPRRLDQVISNLLSNAIKFGDGRPIRVTCEHHVDGVRLRVIDEGIGIAPDDLERIFDQFERAPSARDRGGFGLGLWIAREIVSAHGGTISVVSAPGKGATFTVDLPSASTNAPVAEVTTGTTRTATSDAPSGATSSD